MTLQTPELDLIGTTADTAAGVIRGDLETGESTDIEIKHIEVNQVAENQKTSNPVVPPPCRFRVHRRRRSNVAAAESDVLKVRKAVVGQPEDAVREADTPLIPRPEGRTSTAVIDDDDCSHESMSSNGAGMPGFIDNSPNSASMANMSRQSPSPSPQHGISQPNGAGGMAAGLPMNAGHQMDLNHLYEMVVELSDVLKHNREMTRGIINSAEEIMRRSTEEGASPYLQQVNGEISAARIAELERALAKERRLNEILKREQAENAKLIGEFEAAMGTIVEQIRNYCQNNNMQYLAQKRHYNNLLQAERDAHLASRLDRDYWHAQTMKCAEMIRTAYRLRCEEDDLPTRIISGLQNEVRAYRSALGMEPEKPEEEFGWEYLKNLPPSVD